MAAWTPNRKPTKTALRDTIALAHDRVYRGRAGVVPEQFYNNEERECFAALVRIMGKHKRRREQCRQR